MKRLPVPALEKLAAADCFRSLGLDRRQALWEVKALAKSKAIAAVRLSPMRRMQGAEASLWRCRRCRSPSMW
jgi:DNA polymerase III alpha subunit